LLFQIHLGNGAPGSAACRFTKGKKTGFPRRAPDAGPSYLLRPAITRISHIHVPFLLVSLSSFVPSFILDVPSFSLCAGIPLESPIDRLIKDQAMLEYVEWPLTRVTPRSAVVVFLVSDLRRCNNVKDINVGVSVIRDDQRVSEA